MIETTRLVTLPLASAPFVTRNEPSLKSYGSTPKRRTGSERKAPKKPVQKRTKKPATVSGYHWRKNGAGWDLRKDVYVTSNDGEKKRKQPYIAHLSGEAFGELKRTHKSGALEQAIAQWITDHDR